MNPAGNEDSSNPSFDNAAPEEPQDTRPQPWEGLDSRAAGRILLVLGIAAGAMYLFGGYLYFNVLANPTMSPATLYRSRFLDPDNPSVEGLYRYLLLCVIYALSSIMIGAWLGRSVRTVRMDRIGRVKTLTMVLPFLFCTPGVFLPFFRELLLLMPPAGLLYAASLILHPDNPFRSRILNLGLAAIVPMFLGAAFFHAGRAFGAVTMYILLLAMGLSAIYLVVQAREEHLRRLRLGITAGRDGPGQPVAGPSPGSSPERTPAPPQRDRRAPRPAHLMIAASVVLSALFLPPVWVLDTNASVEIYWQVRTGDQTGDLNSYPWIVVQAVVINRGASAATGVMRLIVRNDTSNFTVGTIDGLEGFGSWYIKHEVMIPNKHEARRNITISLVRDGEVLDTQKMRIPMPNPVLALAAIIVIKSFLDWRRGRR